VSGGDWVGCRVEEGERVMILGYCAEYPLVGFRLLRPFPYRSAYTLSRLFKLYTPSRYPQRDKSISIVL
jgi:hypothetical protein